VEYGRTKLAQAVSLGRATGTKVSYIFLNAAVSCLVAVKRDSPGLQSADRGFW